MTLKSLKKRTSLTILKILAAREPTLAALAPLASWRSSLLSDTLWLAPRASESGSQIHEMSRIIVIVPKKSYQKNIP